MNYLLTFPMKTGQAAFALEEILGIVPDLEDRKRCLIITEAFPEGLTAEEPSSLMIGEWIDMLEENEQEIEADLAKELADIEADLEEEEPD